MAQRRSSAVLVFAAAVSGLAYGQLVPIEGLKWGINAAGALVVIDFTGNAVIVDPSDYEIDANGELLVNSEVAALLLGTGAAAAGVVSLAFFGDGPPPGLTHVDADHAPSVSYTWTGNRGDDNFTDGSRVGGGSGNSVIITTFGGDDYIEFGGAVAQNTGSVTVDSGSGQDDIRFDYGAGQNGVS